MPSGLIDPIILNSSHRKYNLLRSVAPASLNDYTLRVLIVRAILERTICSATRADAASSFEGSSLRASNNINWDLQLDS